MIWSVIKQYNLADLSEIPNLHPPINAGILVYVRSSDLCVPLGCDGLRLVGDAIFWENTSFPLQSQLNDCFQTKDVRMTVLGI